MAERQTLLLELAYRGTEYHGVQAQKDHRTVGGDLYEILTQTCGEQPRSLTFAARTDAGVSAEQNFATCWFPGHQLTTAHLGQLHSRSNTALHIRNASLVPRSVNARTNSCEKHYQYRVNTRIRSTDASFKSSPGVWNICPELHLPAMQHAAKLLVGTHNYSSFRSGRCDSKNPVKTIHELVVTQDSSSFTIDVRGTAFLRNMVRIIVGTLVEVGAGLRPADSMGPLLAEKNRTSSGLTAPATGLWLMAVTLSEPQPTAKCP